MTMRNATIFAHRSHAGANLATTIAADGSMWVAMAKMTNSKSSHAIATSNRATATDRIGHHNPHR